MLVHPDDPKDKCTSQEKIGVVYHAPGKDCSVVYIGETERRYGMKEMEHKRDVKTLTNGSASL